MITAKNTFPSILPIWQKIGASTYRITNFVAKKYGVKATHTGVLDPMAEGVIIVLLGDERYKKMKHTALLKEYEFDILFGISTDTYDGLGLITGANLSTSIKKKSLGQELQSFMGIYSQKVPLYSAQKVDGKKLFSYPKSGKKTPELPIKSGEIHKIKLTSFAKQSLYKNIDAVTSKIQKVKIGDFRQNEIIENWETFKTKTPDQPVVVATIKVTITRGMYIRSLSQDIADKVNACAFVTRLVRTKNGSYGKDQCVEVCLEQSTSTLKVCLEQSTSTLKVC